MENQEVEMRSPSIAEKIRTSVTLPSNYSPLEQTQPNPKETTSSSNSKEVSQQETKSTVTSETSKLNLATENSKLNLASENQSKERSTQLLIASMQQLIKQRTPGERKPFHQKMYKTPKEASSALQTASKNKNEMSIDKSMILSFVSGVFVCFGGGLAINVAYGTDLDIGLKKFLFGSTFQVALVFIILLGGELFTGNTMTMSIGLLTKTIDWKGYCRSLFISFIFNFLGCVFGAAFFNFWGHSFNSEPYLSAVREIAEYKVNLEPQVIFLRAIAANWLVNLAVFMSASAETIEGKILACYIPIMTFAASSFEHCVANMYFVPLGLMYGANTDFGSFLYRNLILSTLGNFIGGAFFMGTVLWWVYLRGTPEVNNKSQSQLNLNGKEVNRANGVKV